MIKIGVIADDFTGATDIASFLVENGLPTVQINGVPTGKMPEAIDALVISLKTRSCPVVEATQQSLAALSWLQQQGCKQIYFKYCSTFDSTAKGNIGPVTDALMDALDTPFTVFSPALPVNGRTVYQGYLFVMNQLLAESGMRHHPVNPMTDSYLPRLVESQSTGRCGVVSAHVFEQGVKAVRQELARLQQEGYRYAVLDALTEHHLEIQGKALRDAPLVTGGSGLAIGLARQWAQENGNQAREAGRPLAGRGVVLSGSCSQMTNRQVAHYRQIAPAREVDVARCLSTETLAAYAHELAEWVLGQESVLAPLVFATASTDALAAIQHRTGEGNDGVCQQVLLLWQKAHNEQQKHFAQNHQLPPVKPLHVAKVLPHLFCHQYAQRKSTQRNQIVQHPIPLTIHDVGTQQHDVAGLCICKHLTAEQIRIGILQPARKRKEHRRQEGL